MAIDPSVLQQVLTYNVGHMEFGNKSYPENRKVANASPAKEKFTFFCINLPFFGVFLCILFINFAPFGLCPFSCLPPSILRRHCLLAKNNKPGCPPEVAIALHCTFTSLVLVTRTLQH